MVLSATVDLTGVFYIYIYIRDMILGYIRRRSCVIIGGKKMETSERHKCIYMRLVGRFLSHGCATLPLPAGVRYIDTYVHIYYIHILYDL